MFDYWIACETNSETLSHELEKLKIPSSTWAIFESKGAMPHAIQDVWTSIFDEFFPDAGFKHSNGPDIELYPAGDVNSQEYRSEIWIPVEKL